MTQPKRKKDEKAELVKLFRTVLPGDFVKVQENGIQSIIEAELSARLGAEPYERVEGRTNYRNGYRERKEALATGVGPVNTTGFNLLPYDLAGNWRVWEGCIDMGCFEYGSPPVANDDPIAPDIPAVSMTAYPNPFSVFTNIKVSTLNSGSDRPESVNNASVTIYNIKGQRVKTIILDHGKTGEHNSW